MADISIMRLSQSSVVLFAVGDWSGEVMTADSGRPDCNRHYRGTVMVGGDQPGRPIQFYHRCSDSPGDAPLESLSLRITDSVASEGLFFHKTKGWSLTDRQVERVLTGSKRHGCRESAEYR